MIEAVTHQNSKSLLAVYYNDYVDNLEYFFTEHNKLFNGSAPPHLVCGWLRHLIHKRGVADRNLNKGVMFLGEFNFD